MILSASNSNLVSTLHRVQVRKGEYIGDVKYRKLVTKRLRALGLNECKTYTLVSPEDVNKFRYSDKVNVVLPNPMSVDKSVVRTSILPSLLNIYEYNKARRVHRGLFVSNTGIPINADLNGAYQILKKVVPIEWDRGWALHPVVVNIG